MVDGPAYRGPRCPPFHELSSQRPMSRNERRASLFRHIDRRKQLIQAVGEAERELESLPPTPVVALLPDAFLLIEHLRGEHLASM
jgi:hypothetical protein